MKRLNKIIINNELMETPKHISDDFPIQFCVTDFSTYESGYIPFHWHLAFEMLLVKEGTIECSVRDKKIKLNTGDGIFINANELHLYQPTSDSDNVTTVVAVFLPEFIAPTNSTIYKNYIQPFMINQAYPFLVFRSNLNWQKDILNTLNDIVSIGQKKEPSYEITVLQKIVDMWQSIYFHLNEFEEIETTSSSTTKEIRIKRMLTFIHENYKENITLEDIASAAFISKTEALRCFKLNLNTTPINYLISYRIEKSKQLLLSTNNTISEIASLCGFESASYFNRRFKEHTMITPMEYRKAM